MSQDKVEHTDDGELDALLEQIFRERKFDFRDYKRPSLKRRIKKRLDANQILTYSEYAKFLDEHPDEYVKLFDTLLINVTEFFRDPEAWEVIDREVLPDILSKKEKGDCIRIWSSGCASGEEPYSIGILLAESLGDSISDYEIKIYATDIDENTLTEARKGVYKSDKLTMIGPERLKNYFTHEEGGYKISRSIRQMVSFGRQDLTSDSPISQLDLLVCRNVLMYFNNNLQNRLMHRFRFAINNGSYVFLGKSEGILMGSKLFKTIDSKWKIYRKF